jgi:hypothetical protein
MQKIYKDLDINNNNNNGIYNVNENTEVAIKNGQHSKKEKRKKYKSSAIKYSNTYTNGKTFLRLFFECSPSNIYNRYPVDFVLQILLLHQYENEHFHV